MPAIKYQVGDAVGIQDAPQGPLLGHIKEVTRVNWYTITGTDGQEYKRHARKLNDLRYASAPRVFLQGDTRPIYSKLKQLGGNWDKEANGWQIPQSRFEEAKALLAAHEATPPKPKVPESLIHAHNVVEAARLLLREAENRQHTVRVNLVLSRVEKEDVNISCLEFGYHECVRSPTLSCVYDTHDDPRMDDCIFCHEPRDRG